MELTPIPGVKTTYDPVTKDEVRTYPCGATVTTHWGAATIPVKQALAPGGELNRIFQKMAAEQATLPPEELERRSKDFKERDARAAKALAGGLLG